MAKNEHITQGNDLTVAGVKVAFHGTLAVSAVDGKTKLSTPQRCYAVELDGVLGLITEELHAKLLECGAFALV